MKHIQFVAIFAFLSATLAYAESEPPRPITDGNSLFEGLRLMKSAQSGVRISQKQGEEAVAAMSFLQGFLGGCGVWQAMGNGMPFRLPKEGLGPMQWIRVVDKYLGDHPERLQEKADLLCILALRDNFPNPDYTGP
jgi:hypothetical protein